MSISIGAHVDQTDPIAEARARQAPLVQFFLGDPQGYKGPEFTYAGGAEGLRADAEAAGVDLYVHAPYIVNVATTNNRIRIPSRKLLQQHMDAAASTGSPGSGTRSPGRRASRTSASAWTPATPGRGASSCPRRWRRSARSRVGSTCCTPTTVATPSTRAPTATPT